MDKASITRQQLKPTILKEVIFSLYHTGFVSVEDTVKNFIQKYTTVFTAYDTVLQSQVPEGIISLQQIADKTTVPITDLQHASIHRFSKNIAAADITTVYIGEYYTAYHIQCQAYKGLDEYMDFFSGYLPFLKFNNPLITYWQFGIRKINTAAYQTEDAVYVDFEPDFLKSAVSADLYKKNTHRFTDALAGNNEDCHFTFSRAVEKSTANNTVSFAATLDIDGYLNEADIAKTYFQDAKFSGMVIARLNDALFDLFKMGMTIAYLERNIK